jgi:hypothetical protein
MNAALPSQDEPLKPLPDEELLDLAHRVYSLVVVRAMGWLMPYVRGLAPRWFQEVDIEDAQDSVIADLMLSLPTFDISQWRTGNGCSFRTFAKNVVKRRFLNILKRDSWVKKHRKSEEDLKRALDARADELDRSAPDITFTESGLSDPLLIAAVNELWERIRRALVSLHPQAWPLWQECCAGKKLSESAPQALRPRMLFSFVLLEEGRDPAAAERSLHAVLALDPDNPDARQNLEILRGRMQQAG